MRQNTQPEKQSLTPMQKQAVLVCIVCALAALLTIGITLVLIHRGKEPAASSEQPGTEQPADDANIADHYQINEQSSALLPETADAGDAYQSETLFIGDSNTVRLYANGLISLQQFCAKEGIGTSAALNEGIVTFKKDSSRYTIAEAVAKMKPRRVVIMLGTNDTGMAVRISSAITSSWCRPSRPATPTPTSSSTRCRRCLPTTPTIPTWTRPGSTTSIWHCCPCVRKWA